MRKFEFELSDFLNVEEVYTDDKNHPDGWYMLYVVKLFGVEVGKYVDADSGMHESFPVYGRSYVEAHAEDVIKKLWEGEN